MDHDTGADRMYLEDVGEIVMSRAGKDIWLIKSITQHEDFRDRCLPERIYVVDFPGRGAGEEFLLNRQACGPEKFLMIKEVGHDMIRLFERMFDGKVAQYVILWGGRPLRYAAEGRWHAPVRPGAPRGPGCPRSRPERRGCVRW